MKVRETPAPPQAVGTQPRFRSSAGVKMAQIAGCVPASRAIRRRAAIKPQVAGCAPCGGDHTTSILRQKAVGSGANRGLCARGHSGLGSHGPKALAVRIQILALCWPDQHMTNMHLVRMGWLVADDALSGMHRAPRLLEMARLSILALLAMEDLWPKRFETRSSR